MSEEKKEARETLLGELESIKTLLSEEEWEHIPVLDDPVTGPNPVVDLETVSGETPQLQINADLFPDEQPDMDELDLSDELDLADGLAFADEHLAEADLAADDLEEVDIPVLEEVYTPATPQTDSGPLPVVDLNDDNPAPTSDPLPLLTEEDLPLSTKEPASFTVGPDVVPEAPADVESTGNSEAAEEPQADTAAAPAAAIAAARPFAPRTPEFKAQELRQRLGNKRPLVEPRGENPFLPQHIRDRLHSQKALVDIIRESPSPAADPVASSPDAQSAAEPLPKVLPQEKLNQLIDGLVAIYLPKIETELRARLHQALQEDSFPEE